MVDFLTGDKAIELAKQKWFESISSTILITGIDSFQSALNNKLEYAGVLAALDHSSTILHHLQLAQCQLDKEWESPEIVVEFREKMDRKKLIGITDYEGNVSLPGVWIHLGHGCYEYPIRDAGITLGYDDDKEEDWIDTQEIFDFLEQCDTGHILLVVLPICKSKFSKDVLSKSDKISLIMGDDEEDIDSSKVGEYLNELQNICKETHLVHCACIMHPTIISTNKMNSKRESDEVC